GAVRVTPEVNESGFTRRCLRFEMVETVDADLHGAIALHHVRLESAGNKFSPNISAANVFLDAFGQLVFTLSHTALIVIELYVIGEEAAKFRKIAVVVRIEHRCVQ